MLKVGGTAPMFDCHAVVARDVVEMGWNELQSDCVLVLLFDSLADDQSLVENLRGLANARDELERLQVKTALVCRDQVYDIQPALDRACEVCSIDELEIPILIDTDGQIASMYGMSLTSGDALWGQCIIDSFGIVRQFSQSSVPTGLNVDELLRCVQAILHPTADWPC